MPAGIVGNYIGWPHQAANNPYAHPNAAAARGLEEFTRGLAQPSMGRPGRGGIGSSISAPNPTPVDPAIGQMLMQMMSQGRPAMGQMPNVIPGVNDPQTLLRLGMQQAGGAQNFVPGNRYYEGFVASQQPKPGTGGGQMNINTGFAMPQFQPQQFQPQGPQVFGSGQRGGFQAGEGGGFLIPPGYGPTPMTGPSALSQVLSQLGIAR